jgi:hypothetical protein
LAALIGITEHSVERNSNPANALDNVKSPGSRKIADPRPLHRLDAPPAEGIIPDAVPGLVDHALQPVLQHQVLLLGQPRALEDRFLNPDPIVLYDFMRK